MRTLRLGDRGQDVALWETFLVGQGYYWTEVDGLFNEDTKQSTIDFQRGLNLTPDGTVGPKTYAAALQRGFPGIEDESQGEDSPNWPPCLIQPVSSMKRAELFGTFAFKPAGNPSNPEAILITDGWGAQNIAHVEIPQLKGVIGAPGSGIIPFHTKAAKQLQMLFAAWEEAGLLPLVLSFAGSWAPRYVRGSRQYLSNHAWGTAFDINVPQNPLGAVPALVGKSGSVRKLVALANAHGFYWGGHFERQDGMHFEVARLI